MKPLKHEYELQKILNCLKIIYKDNKLYLIPEIYQFSFIEDYRLKGYAEKDTNEIALSLCTCGEFSCKNDQFIRTVIHEITHINYWKLGHKKEFFDIVENTFNKVKKLMED